MGKTVLGVDVGKTGALVWYDGKSITCVVRPTIISIDGKDQVNWLDLARGMKNCPVSVAAYIEDVHAMPKQGVTSMFNFGYVSGFVRGIIEYEKVLDCGTWVDYDASHIVIMVTPQAWKKAFGLIKQPKEAAIGLAQHLIPKSADLIEDDGVADAALIAYYGWCREMKVGDFK